MKIHRVSVRSAFLPFVVVVLSGLAWWAGTPARAAAAPTVALIPVSGIVSGQPESVTFSGQAQISSELILDTSRFHRPPSVNLVIDLSKVSGTGSSTGAKYAAGGNGSSVFRQLVSADTIEMTFPFSRGTAVGTSSVRTGVVSFTLSFDLNTGAIMNGTANIAGPSFPY